MSTPETAAPAEKPKGKNKKRAAKKKAAPKPEAAETSQAEAPPPQNKKPKRHVVEMGAFERVLIEGDLSGLTEQERIKYYRDVCAMMGLNPMTRPFQYVTFWEERQVKDDKTGRVEKKWVGALQLYATRSCADQLCGTRNISTQVMSYREGGDGLYYVQVRASDGTGRFADRIGVVDITGMKGKSKANAVMKAETKGGRRAVLGLCGLSMMDETEVEDLPASMSVTAGDDAVRALESRHVSGNSPRALSDQSGGQPPIATTTVETREKAPVQAQERHPNAPPDDDEPAQGGQQAPKADTTQISSGADDRIDVSKYPGSGVKYPQPPFEVIKMHEDGRYMRFLVWVEKDIEWAKWPGAGAALKIDFKNALKGAKEYGGSHWRRMLAAFDASDSPVAKEHR